MGVPFKKQSSDFTSLLRQFQQGDEQALDALVPIVYAELKKLAKGQLRNRGGINTLCPTVLVHDVFMRMKTAEKLELKDRAHFFAVAARTMRWLITDYARAKMSEKRGGPDAVRIVFDESKIADESALEFPALDSALALLEKEHPRLYRVVELRYLVGLTIQETSIILGLAPMTVNRDWTRAKAWLARQMSTQA